MTSHPVTSRPVGTPHAHRRAFSLVEVIFALLLVGLVYVAALNTLTAARIGQVRTHHEALAIMLAQQRISELLPQPYAVLQSQPRTEFTRHPGWHHEIIVEHVQPSEPGSPATTDTGVKRLRVIVSQGSTEMAELVSLRTHAMPDMATPLEAVTP